MPFLKRGNLGVGKAMEAAMLLRLDPLHALGRTGVAPFQLDRHLHHFAQHLAQAVAAVRSSGAPPHQLFHFLCLESDGALVAEGRGGARLRPRRDAEAERRRSLQR